MNFKDWLQDDSKVSFKEITSFMQEYREDADLPWLGYFPNLWE